MYLGSTESIKLFLENSDCMGIVSIRSICKGTGGRHFPRGRDKGYAHASRLLLCPVARAGRRVVASLYELYVYVPITISYSL